MFKLVSEYKPKGDQPQAIETITSSIQQGHKYQTLLGVTGSGKTFTMANIISKLNMPTLIMTHNKTLAAQLYSEFKTFFPKNHVEYFISYYDYYQPEAYIPRQDLFIEKDIHVLEKRANSLQKQAVALYWLVIIVFCIAAGIAIYRMLFSDHTPLVQKDHTALWIDFTIGTIKGFTAYGLLVLIGVTAWKQSKAKYDQAERLYAKRRQNRQLRLYIHLSDGQIKYEEFLKFLKFAQNENNAFEQIKADAKAPLGNLINDLLKTQSDIIKVLSPKEKK